MSRANDTQSREERLAAKLRENLHRRKAQSREAGRAQRASPGESPAEGLSKPDDAR